jgi:hypothetical protein
MGPGPDPASAALFLASAEARYITGEILRVAGGMGLGLGLGYSARFTTNNNTPTLRSGRRPRLEGWERAPRLRPALRDGRCATSSG